MDITALLKQAASGDAGAEASLFEQVYEQLKAMALNHRGRWHGDDTLSATALVHEAWLKLAVGAPQDWESRGHYFSVASQAMRQILVDKARSRMAAKRGGAAVHVDVDSVAQDDVLMAAEDILALHEHLARLEQTHPRQARVVECRFFGGLQMQEISEALSISLSTVHRDWELARVWLYQVISQTSP